MLKTTTLEESVDAINLLRSAASVNDLVSAGTRWAHATGFEHWVFCIGAPATPRLIGYLPDAFINAGIDASELCNPLLALAERSHGPVIWDPDPIAGPCRFAPSENQRRQLQTLCALGFRSGIAGPINSPDGRIVCVFAASNTRTISPDIRRGQEPMVVAFSIYFQHAILRILGEETFEPQYAMLAARELECLRWVDAGKTSDEIAEILSLSPSTVNFHITNAARKFGVKGRQQAIQRASKLRLL